MAARATGRPRLRPGRLFLSAATLLLALATTPLTLAAQDPPPLPPPPDTVDVVAPPADTLAPAPADTLPPPVLVPFPATRLTGAAAGVWRWDRAALLAEVVLSLADLLERLPGVDVLRAGTQLQPEAGRALGGTSDRFEIVLDGYVLDPLHAAILDLSTIRLAQLAEVVVERRLDVLRVHLRTDESLAPDPYSRIEALLGVPALNAFRGVLLVPHFAFGPFGAAVERLETDGRFGAEPADIFGTWLKWGWLREDYGVQAELNRYTLNRRGGSPWPGREERQDFVVRGRAAPAAGLVAEAYIGRSAVERFAPPVVDTVPGIRQATTQAGLRAGYDADAFAARGALRWRSHAALPSLQADIGGTALLGTVAELDAEVTHTIWRVGPSRLGGRVYAGAAPLGWLRIFGEASRGERAAPRHLRAVDADTLDDTPPELEAPIGSNRTALRAGAAIQHRRVSGGGALLRVETDSVPAFRMPFDSLFALLPGGATSGVEAWGRVPVPRTALAVEGSVVNWFAGDVWAYQPQRTWRAGLVLNASPLPTGNLRIIGRAEARHRGAYLAPVITDGAPELAVVPASTGVDASLIIHIIDVQIVGRYDNVGGRMLADAPGRPPPGARFFYGVKWSFRN